jgi:hypothetical protein
VAVPDKVAAGRGDVVYRIDERDRIVFCDEGWDAFAAANDGEAAASARVLLRPLWDFVSDPTTRDLYRQVILRARAARTLRFTIRCDSPTRRRLLELSVSPGEGGWVEFRTRVLAEEERPPQPLWEPRAARSGELLRVCGWCKKVFVGDGWAEVEEAADRLKLFELPALPLLTHGICEACYGRVAATLAGS